MPGLRSVASLVMNKPWTCFLNQSSGYDICSTVYKQQSVSSDEAENVSNNSSTQHDVWANLGAERPYFHFTGKPGINVDLEDPSNPLEYFELFCTADIAEVIARETNQYAQKILENRPNPKLKSRTHCWAGIENCIIIKYSPYLPLELQQCFQWCSHFSDDFIGCKKITILQ
jgi:hypothetical protein